MKCSSPLKRKAIINIINILILGHFIISSIWFVVFVSINMPNIIRRIFMTSIVKIFNMLH